MAAFTAKDPDDRTAFDAHMAKVRTLTETSFANGRNTEIEETILRLDEPTKAAPFDASSGKQRTH